MSFKDFFRNKLHEKGLTQNAFAEMVGVSSGQISKWASGREGVSAPTLARIAAAIGMSVEELSRAYAELGHASESPALGSPALVRNSPAIAKTIHPVPVRMVNRELELEHEKLALERRLMESDCRLRAVAHELAALRDQLAEHEQAMSLFEQFALPLPYKPLLTVRDAMSVVGITKKHPPHA